MATGHARLKAALVLRDALTHELGLELRPVMRVLSELEDTVGAQLAMSDGRYLAQLESLCTSDPILLTEADQMVRSACRKLGLAPRYAQYLALILFAHWVRCKQADEAAFVERLNAFLAAWAEKNPKETISPFVPDDLQFAAIWMATGSGKTHVLHACLSMLHEAKTWDRTILITPTESLSRQHAEKLRETNAWDVFAYPTDGDAASLGRLHPDTIIVIDINKLTETKKGDGVSLPTSVFKDGRNLVFVDEGHKGQRTEQSVWKKLQSDLAGIGSIQTDHRGLLVEFSATFGQVAETEATFDRYAKSIMLDYAYDRFHSDQYGKDFWSIKIDANESMSDNAQETTLAAALVSYWYQLNCYGQSKVQSQVKKAGVEIAKPLWVLLGLSVIGSKSNQADKDQTSDVISVLKFLNQILSSRTALEQMISEVLAFEKGGAELLPPAVSEGLKGKKTSEICTSILIDVFGFQEGDAPLFRILKTSPGELGLGLRRGDRVHYFGVVNVGDVNGLKKALEADLLEVEDDAFTPSLFVSLEKENSGVNLLIGSRRFAEGWDNYRASSLTLLRLGQNEGSLIIQMFGRVVRFAGKNGNGKRSSNPTSELDTLQTAFIFGLKSRYLQAFLIGLFENGIVEKTKTYHPFHDWLPENPELLSVRSISPDKSAYEVHLTQNDWTKSVNKIVVSYAVGVASSQVESSELSNKSHSYGADITPDFKTKLGLIDFAAIYTELANWKALSQRWNMSFDIGSIEAALRSDRYELFALPSFVIVKSDDDLVRIQSAAVTITRKIFEGAYRKAEAQKSSYEVVNARNSGIPTQYFKEVPNDR